MKIQKVIIKDFKVLHDVEQEINGANILLVGDNGVGKSSFMQFIEIALGKQTNIPKYAEGEGMVIADSKGNKYTFSVKFKNNKPVVTVTTEDGMKDTRKGILGTIAGAMDLDINKFVELSKTTAGQKKQVEIFKSFFPQEIIEELDRLRMHVKSAYDERTELNREIKTKEATINSHELINLVGAGQVFEKVDAKDILEQITKGNNANQQIRDVQSRLEQREEELKEKEADLIDKYKELEELQAKIEGIKKVIEGHKNKNQQAQKFLKENKEVDLKSLETQLTSIQEINARAEAADALKKDIETLQQMKEDAGELTAKIESQNEAIDTAIREMESPVEGVSYSHDDYLLYNGVPVSPDNLSTSEIIELGIKLKMAENPDLGILFIEHGESLGSKRLKEIKDLAEANNWQIIMEQVERGTEKLQIEIMT
jgi:DNA repair exonuclease SbcCD ATPase subunit